MECPDLCNVMAGVLSFVLFRTKNSNKVKVCKTEHAEKTHTKQKQLNSVLFFPICIPLDYFQKK